MAYRHPGLSEALLGATSEDALHPGWLFAPATGANGAHILVRNACFHDMTAMLVLPDSVVIAGGAHSGLSEGPTIVKSK